jgi:hypothetical protein
LESFTEKRKFGLGEELKGAKIGDHSIVGGKEAGILTRFSLMVLISLGEGYLSC